MSYKDRKEYNEKILQALKDYFELCPNMRFGQALLNLGILDRGTQIQVGKHVYFYHSDVVMKESKDVFDGMFGLTKEKAQSND